MQDRLENLKAARCWKDEHSYGKSCSSWIGLSKFDVEWAVFEIETLREKLKEKYAKNPPLMR
jgi:hypothetical protein